MSSVADSTGFHVTNLLQYAFHFAPGRIDGLKFILDRKIPGDFIVRAGATDEQLRTALEKILSGQFDTPISLTFHEVPTDVYVLRGQWKPADANASFDKIHFYIDDMSDDSNVGNGMVGGLGLRPTIERFIHALVFVEAKDVPQTISYVLHRGVMRNPDAAVLLDHIAEQTGLTWSKESRPLRHVSVEQQK